MIRDLQGSGEHDCEADFIVIGAGTVGLPSSVLLARGQARVVCLESGGERQAQELHPLNEVVQHGASYGGAQHGRFRCLGGTSTRWGGALIPFQQADLEQGGWPLSCSDLDPYVAEVEALFGLEHGPYHDPDFPLSLGTAHVQRLAKWPPFRRRNVVALVGDEARSSQRLDVWLNATATDIDASGGRVQVVARSAHGDRIRVTAPRLIVAAGAIETTRLAWLIDRRHGGAVSAASPALGRYFSDHLSVAVAEIEPIRRSALNRIIGFRFGTGARMRNIRFEPAAQSRDGLPPYFAHVGFELARAGGFDALRELLRCVQARRLPSPGLAADLCLGAPWLARAVWWRYAHRRLLFPAHASLVVHMVMEQVPRADNRITLDSERTDAFGLPLARIDWRVGDDDIAHVHGASARFEATWQRSGLGAYGRWRSFAHERLSDSLRGAEGIFHPTGSTRMGHDAASGVVDRDLRLFALPQVQLLSTAALPTGGGANPTMMLLLLAMRCVAQHRAAGDA